MPIPVLKLVAAVCLAEVCTMVGVFTFPALLPGFMEAWGLSNTQAGWISGVYFAAYALAAPVLVTLTDRVDARRVYAVGAALNVVACAGFALLADGFWPALVFRALGGAALAGTYMPGLRVLVDRVPDAARPRVVPLYTACFSLGTAGSYAASAGIAAWAGWQTAFAVAAASAALAVGIVLLLKPRPPVPSPTPTRLLDFRPVFRNRPAMAYVLGYFAHMWELFAYRSWVVGFLAFAAALPAADAAGWSTGVLSPNGVATVGALIAFACSIGGAELATRLGRGRTVMGYMVLSGLAACTVGPAAAVSYPLAAVAMLVWIGLIQLDSAALTTGAVEHAEDGRRGATLAVHSLIGFLAAFLGPLAVGVVLDAAGGAAAGTGAGGWTWAFVSVGAVGLLGPFAMAWGLRHQRGGGVTKVSLAPPRDP